MTRKRGAPPGNKNALKHGFYSRDFPKTDLQDLQAIDSKGVTEEIGLVRLHLRKLTEHAFAATTLAEYLDILRVSNLYTSNLNRLIRTQILVAQAGYRPVDGPDGNLSEMLDRVLAEVQATWPDY